MKCSRCAFESLGSPNYCVTCGLNLMIKHNPVTATTTGNNDINTLNVPTIEPEPYEPTFHPVQYDVYQPDAKKEITEFTHGLDPVTDYKFMETYTHTLCREFRGQTHYRPNKETKYWVKDKFTMGKSSAVTSHAIDIEHNNVHNDNKNEKKVLAILVPFYNEEAEDLTVTLKSLHQDISSIEDLGFDVHVLLVMDGWWKASESMKKLIVQMFPKNDNGTLPWWMAIKPIEKEELSKCVSTFIMQRMVPGGESVSHVDIGEGKQMKISLIVKRDNRRKINAHDWMLRSFADFYKAHFVFLTDCGTLFEQKCLTRLTKELIRRPDCTAVSGRQRVMTAEQQNMPGECCGMASMFRAAQCYDYESSLAVFVGGFSLAGMLPVIPGPCGLYRYQAIKEKAVPFYLNTVAAHPGECGILLANLNLAEDRVLSYAAVLRTHENAYTCYVPEAIFYFAAETLPLQLFQQRRRWINGTIAGYIWLLSNPHMITDSGIRSYNKPIILLLLLCQMLMYIAVALSPAIFMMTFYWSMQWIEGYLSIGNGSVFGTNMSDFLTMLYAVMYIVFVAKHSRVKQKPPVSTLFVYFATFINAIAMIFIMASMICGSVFKFGNTETLRESFAGFQMDSFIKLVVLFAFIGPMILAAMHSLKSLWLMMTSIIQFYLLLPTMVIYIGAFSLSRVWDLSWGNRPSEESSLKSTMTAEQRQQTSNNIKKIGMFIAYGVVFINMLLVFIVLASPNQRQTYVNILAIFIFVGVIFQMTLSLLYFIGRNVRRVLRCIGRRCCVDLCRRYTKNEWYGET